MPKHLLTSMLLFVCGLISGRILQHTDAFTQLFSPNIAHQEYLCSFEIKKDYITMDLLCLSNPSNKLLQYNFTKNIEAQWKDIDGFTNYYQDQVKDFSYTPSQPVWKNQEKQAIVSYWQKKVRDMHQAKQPGNTQVSMPLDERYVLAMQQYGYFSTQRNISDYGYCSGRNYYVAAISIDKKHLKPGDEFHLNKRLAHRSGYCKQTIKDYLFYGGVCGAATQVFRIGLLHPDIEILNRFSHNTRYTKYYGDLVRGDDAAIAEYHKTLVLKNSSPHDIYFKYLDIDPDKTVAIVAITPTNNYSLLTTRINKENLGPLQGKVTATSKLGEKRYPAKKFISTYLNIETGSIN